MPELCGDIEKFLFNSRNKYDTFITKMKHECNHCMVTGNDIQPVKTLLHNLHVI